jgi:membrane-associated phospholipid phosphatase
MIRTIRFTIAPSLMLLIQLASANAGSIVTEWLDEVLPAAKEVAWEPTVGARFLAIVHSAMYDAWTAYDPVAVGYVTGSQLRGQGGLNNEANKREAISHATFTVLTVFAPQRRRALVERMQALGYDPNANTAAAKVGRRAALAVLDMRREDGSNETDNFADTTGFAAPSLGHVESWQPIAHLGKRQLPTSPHWGRVLPFALTRADQFRPISPPAGGSAAWSQQLDVLVNASAALTDTQKAAAEYWGIWGLAPPPHLLELTKFFSNSNDLRLDDDVKLFFVVSNAVLDASVATWECKYAYDYVRPITAIRALGDVAIKAWRPRSQPVAFAYSAPLTRGSADAATVLAGPADIRATEWESYLPTPPFPAYVSGHSAFTAAWAKVMELATGQHGLNFRKTVKYLEVEQRQLTEPVTLDYPTFASAAEASGISRIWAGIHWPADDLAGHELGHRVGENAWRRAQQFFLGTASPATAAFLALRPPYWFHDNLTPDHPARFQATGGTLAIDVSAGGVGVWRSIVLDSMAAGNYSLQVAVAGTGGTPVHMTAMVESAQGGGVFGKLEAVVEPAETSRTVTLPWTSDGEHAFRISIAARGDGANTKLLVSSMSERRIWPTLPGPLRYYEMRGIGLPD